MASTVGDLMTREVVAVRQQATFKEILTVMQQRRFSAFPVLDDDNHVVGVVSEADLLVREAFAGHAPGPLARHSDRVKAGALTAGKLMTKPAVTIRPTASLAEAARLMHARHVKRLPVVDASGRLVGVRSRVDLLSVYDRPDEEIEAEVLAVIKDDFCLDPLAFVVTVAGGVVTIAGQVDSESVAQALVDALWRIDGVITVRDRLSYLQREPVPGMYGPFRPGPSSTGI
jgi:CBS domain-containing protein